MSAKNSAIERSSARVPSKPLTSSSAEESSQKPEPGTERMVSDAGLKRKQDEMGVNESENLISSVEAKISKAEEVQILFFSFNV